MIPSANDIWSNALERLSEVLPERTFKNWVVKVEPASIEATEDPPKFILQAPSRFCKDYLLSNFRRQLTQAVNEAVGKSVNLYIKVNRGLNEQSLRNSEEMQKENAVERKGAGDRESVSRTEKREGQRNNKVPVSSGAPLSSPPQNRVKSVAAVEGDADDSGSERSPFHHSNAQTRLREDFTFEQFLEGDSNRMARSASIAVAKDPGGTKYNPLVMYGEVGLGKTHLAQAIANYAAREQTAQSICYVSSEKFTSEFVTAIRNDQIRAFSRRYRKVDLLVVDDVQFFGGKEKTQEEFFHLFNDLHQHGKQIVLCADRPPSKIEGIEERLLSRFQWGLTADIRQPDFEMRLAVLQLKASNLDLQVESDVLELIARNIHRNVRKLEGALKQLSARAHLAGTRIDVPQAKTILQDHFDIEETSRQVQVEDIIQVVASHYQLEEKRLISRGRKQRVAHARQVAMYLSRQLTERSYASIGNSFGGRDHSTVMYACKKIEDLLEVDNECTEDVNAIQRRLNRRAYH